MLAFPRDKRLGKALLLLVVLLALLFGIFNVSLSCVLCSSGARDVIAPVHKRAVMHRRHQSSGAAFVHQAGSSSAAVAADDQQQHMPHIHSMPAVHEAAAAAAAAGSGSSHAVGGGGSAAGFAGGANDRGQGSAVPYASVFQIGAEDMVLQPGQSLSIPMWVHVEQSGRFSFQCAWFCEPQVRRARWHLLWCCLFAAP